MRQLGKDDRRNAIWIPLFGLLCVVSWSVYSLLHISPFAASWDEVDFVLALDRFDLLAMQPHFPGYPYFVLGAMAVQQVVNDPLIAYGTLNIMLTASAAVPIWLIARRLLSPAWSLLVVLITLTSPYLWLQTMRPMSEAAGIAVLWWYLWCWWRAMERRTWLSAILALFLFGVLMGVRLSFVPFGLSLVWLLGVRCADWRYEGKRLLPRVTGFVLLAGGFQLLWVAGLALSEGGFVGFAELAAAFTEGHFSQWGGGVISAASVPLAERALRFAGDNLLWTGMFARSTALLAAAAALLLAAVLRAGANSAPRGSAGSGSRRAPLAAAWLRRPALPGALALLAGAYGAWALLAQNIDKPRHITPLIGLMWLLLLALFRAAPPARLPAQASPSAATANGRLPAQAPPSAASPPTASPRRHRPAPHRRPGSPRRPPPQRHPAQRCTGAPARAAHPPRTASRRRAARGLRRHAASDTRRPACSTASERAASCLPAGRCLSQPDGWR